MTTIDSATASNAGTIDPSGSFDSNATTTGIELNPIMNPFGNEPQNPPQPDNVPQQQQVPTMRHNIRGVQRAALKPADQAFLPQPTISSRIIAAVPLLGWFTGSMIGSEVPRTDAGEFDWNRASLYWKIIWFLDYWINLCGGDITGAANKDD